MWVEIDVGEREEPVVEVLHGPGHLHVVDGRTDDERVGLYHLLDRFAQFVLDDAAFCVRQPKQLWQAMNFILNSM